MVDTLTPWLPVVAGVAAAVVVAAAIGKGMLITYQHVKGRRAGRIAAIVTPLLNERLLGVDTAILNLRLELGETNKVLHEVKAIVSDGLQDDVAYLRTRVDGIYDHLIP